MDSPDARNIPAPPIPIRVGLMLSLACFASLKVVGVGTEEGFIVVGVGVSGCLSERVDKGVRVSKLVLRLLEAQASTISIGTRLR